MAKRIKATYRSEEVELENEDGTVTKYFVREFSGPERDKFMNWQRSKTITTTDSKTGEPRSETKDFLDQTARLLEVTVWETDSNGKLTKLVPKAVIDSWSSTTQADLAQIASDVCVLGLKGVEETKNESPGQTEVEK